MELNKIHKAYFVGIGGIGMSALARFFKQQGASVSGYDKTKTPLTEQLQKEGLDVHYQDDIALVPTDADLYIYTPAIPPEHKGLRFLKEHNFPLYKRSEVLGFLSRSFQTIAIAGTHGKTTICSMLTHLFLAAGIPVNAFIGGIAVNLNSNFVFRKAASVLIVEADEYDRSFLKLKPEVAVVSAVDEDHLDVYGAYDELKTAFAGFLHRIEHGGLALIHERVELSCPDKTRLMKYGQSENVNFRLQNVRQQKGAMVFDFQLENESLSRLKLHMPGLYNVENALVASAVARVFGISQQAIRKGLNTYKGVKRRFEIRVNTARHIYVDDYAHHPRELEACICAAREFFPGNKITVAFQPHLYTRTRDLARGFSESLSLADEVVLLDIYPAREKAIPGVHVKMLMNNIDAEQIYYMSNEEMLEFVKHKQPGVFMTLGAGNIDQMVEDVTNILNQR
ncbi:MAG: UDP-N-acetylmuramate--L-alanine ligase [Bacteroidales bacterium]